MLSAPLSQCCLNAVNAASLTFTLPIRMSNRHWDINKMAQSNQYGHGWCPCLCFMVVFAFFSSSLVFYFFCFSVISKKKNLSQRQLPSPFSIPFGAIDSTLSLSGVRDSLHATDSKEMGFWIPRLPAFLTLSYSFRFCVLFLDLIFRVYKFQLEETKLPLCL